MAVAPSGMVTFFDNSSPGSWAYRTDANGAWAKPDTLSASTTAFGPPQVAFDAAGNGLAVWRAETVAGLEEILSSRFTLATGKWSPASVVPGSQASAAGTDYERGVPALAMDSEGNAVALWINRKGSGSAEALMASDCSKVGTWGTPVQVAPSLLSRPTFDAPGLVFDGEDFVVAFTATDGHQVGAYTARRSASGASWSSPERRQAAGDAASATRMPRLAGDRRGNLILVWTTGSAPSFKLVYQRYSQGSWGETKEIPDGTFDNEYFTLSNYPMPLTVNDSGYGALAWGDYDASHRLTKIRLASFF
ncbi:MAG TPA: hypothetical protein VHB79_10470 [Polyangiaceae bacterium]|nr:hypothetical protein [Polyangiaceae bacterium]